MNGIKIKFWGVRGSFPIPRAEDSFGGNTSCIEVRTSDQKVVLFDMGTGLKNFGESLSKTQSNINANCYKTVFTRNKLNNVCFAIF